MNTFTYYIYILHFLHFIHLRSSTQVHLLDQRHSKLSSCSVCVWGGKISVSVYTESIKHQQENVPNIN